MTLASRSLPVALVLGLLWGCGGSKGGGEPAARCAGVVCTALDQCHQAGSCDPASGACSNPARANGATCDDGNACTSGDTCLAGACAAGAPRTCLPSDRCHDAGTCDAATGSCSDPPSPTGTACSDGDACNGAEACDGAGRCLAGSPPVVDDGDPCTVDSCDPATGQVTHSALASCAALPPDPATVATPTDPTIPTSLYLSTLFLYTGASPIQTGVADGTIDPTRAAVLRGRVVDRDGGPLPGAVVSIVGQPQYGQTLSRADGRYDLAVNGGGPLVVGFLRTGALPAQRPVDVPWSRYLNLPDVTLLSLDPRATVVNLASSDPLQVARGSLVTDPDGSRQATLLIPRGTQASLVLPGGSTRPLTSLTLRATEYTVGARGPSAMPAPLPTASGYTYAVELSADEALAAGATDVVFDRPLFFYVDDFIGFPVGSAVPAGYLDREKGVWVASENGRVVRILGITGGLAELDTDGDGSADDAATLAALGVTEVERARLASTYPVVPRQLWRVPVRHFSPWDCNWPYGPPPDAVEPDQPPKVQAKEDQFTIECASLVETQNQILGEAVNIPGTPYALHYSSDRVPGRTAGRTLEIKLTGDHPLASRTGIELEVEVAGQVSRQAFPEAPNLSTTFTWDGKDVYGRKVMGTETARVSVRYGYVVVYYPVRAELQQSFGRFSPSAGFVQGPVARLIWISRDFSVDLVGDADFHGLGGWSLDPHHVFDHRGGLFLGDGQRRSPRSLGAPLNVVSTAAGGVDCTWHPDDGSPAVHACLDAPVGVGIGGDGRSYYVVDGCVVYAVDSNSRITLEAGRQGYCGYSGDGVLAWNTTLSYPRGGCALPGGGGYVADTGNHRIRRITPDSLISTAAGTGTAGFGGDDGPATAAQLHSPSAVVMARDGNLYVADTGNDRIRRVGPDGIITTIAGGGGLTPCYGLSGDGGPAADACLSRPLGLALGPDGSLYVADSGNSIIRRIRPDGVIVAAAGSGLYGAGGDGGPALLADLASPSGIAVGPDGTLFIADSGNDRVRTVTSDGIIATLAGGYPIGSDGDGIPATWAPLGSPSSVALAADGSLYVADTWNGIVRRVWNLLGYSSTASMTASLDGDERYEFDVWGRHLRTSDALTGSIRYELGYDASGRLVGITDLAGDRTTIERDAAGQPTAIVAPDGRRTSLTIGADGYLASVVKPGGETTTFGYAPGGLLSSMTDPAGVTSTYQYDPVGRLSADARAGGLLSLERTPLLGGFQVATSTAAGALASFEVMYPDAGGSRWTDRSVDGRTQTLTVTPDGGQTLTRADGTVVTSVRGPDPRFGMAAPILRTQVIRTPGGLVNGYARLLTSTPAAPGAPGSYGSLHSVRTVNGRSWVADVDAVRLQATTSSPAGRVTTTDFDAAGRIVRTQRADRAPTAYAYDARGRLASMIRGAGAGARGYAFGYDAAGDLARVTYPDGRSVQYRHDATGRVTSQVFPDGREVAYGRDARGKLVSFTPPGRPLQAISYTPTGLLAGHALPGPGGADQLLLERGADDLVTRRVRPDGTAVDYLYDAARRLVGKAAGGEQIGYDYDPATGHLSAIARSGVGTISYGWDGFLQTQVSWQGLVSGVVSRSHDDDFRLTSLGVNGVGVPFSHDLDGLLTAAGDLIIARDPLNGSVAATSIGGVADTRVSNEFSELVGYTATWLGTELYSAQYTRDLMGRVATRTETLGGGPASVTAYAYDAAGRLASVTRDGALEASYTHDANGNRLSRSTPGEVVTATYDVRDRLLQAGPAGYTWTGNGELLSRTEGGATTSYAYDGFGVLVGVTLPDGRILDYVVDGAGRRIGKAVDGVLTRGFLYQNALKPVAELDGAGNLVSLFVYGTSPWVPDTMVRVQEGRTYRLLSDHRGSVRLVVDAGDGTVAQRLDYGPLGEVILDTQPGFQPFGFAGGLYDPDTGLTRFGRRDYDAATGRWTTQDPILFASRSTNYYQYASDDPVNLHDPSGRLDVTDSELPPGSAPERVEGENGNYEEYGRTKDGIDYERSCTNGVCAEKIYDRKTHTFGEVMSDHGVDMCSGPGCKSIAEANAEASADAESFEPAPATPPPAPSAPSPETPPPPGGGGPGSSPGAGSGGGGACSVNIWRDSSGNVIRRVRVPQ